MKNKAIVAAIGAMVGLGAAGAAHADAYAFASSQLTNLTIGSTATFTVTGSPTRDTVTTAVFSGFPASAASAPQAVGAPSDALQATSGPGPFPAQNTFSPTVGIRGNRGDAFSAAGSPFSAGGVPVVNDVAEGLALSGTGASGISSGRNVADIMVTLTNSGTFTFSFTGSIRLDATTAAIPGENAQASITTSFTIFDSTGATVYDFAPDGVPGDPGDISDPFSLQRTCVSNSGIPAVGCPIGPVTGFFSGTSPTLVAGDYLIALRAPSQASQVTALAVPEPTSILLVGAGIFGLGIMRRRKRA